MRKQKLKIVSIHSRFFSNAFTVEWKKCVLRLVWSLTGQALYQKKLTYFCLLMYFAIKFFSAIQVFNVETPFFPLSLFFLLIFQSSCLSILLSNSHIRSAQKGLSFSLSLFSLQTEQGFPVYPGSLCLPLFTSVERNETLFQLILNLSTSSLGLSLYLVLLPTENYCYLILNCEAFIVSVFCPFLLDAIFILYLSMLKSAIRVTRMEEGRSAFKILTGSES